MKGFGGGTIAAGILGLAAVLAQPAQATPGFHLIVNDLTNPDQYTNWFPTTTATYTGPISIGGYQFGVLLNSNYAGAVTIGTLSMQITFTGSGTGPQDHLTFEAFVADSNAPTIPLQYTKPSGTAWILEGSGSANGNGSIGSLTMTATNTINATALVGGPVSLNPPQNTFSGTVQATSLTPGYTLSAFVDVNNVTAAVEGGLSGITLQDTLSVTKMPEPVSLVLMGSGIAALGLVRRRR